MLEKDRQESSIGQLERYEEKKIFALKGLVASFTAWQLGQIVLNNFADLLHISAMAVFQGLNFIGALSWVAFVIYLITISRFLNKSNSLKSQVNDERMSLLRLRAMSYGFMITIGVTSLLFGASTLVDALYASFELTGTFISQSILLVAIASAWISYLILDRDE